MRQDAAELLNVRDGHARAMARPLRAATTRSAFGRAAIRVSVGLLLVSVAGCRSQRPQTGDRPEPPPVITPVAPRQDLVAVHLFGIHEEVDPLQDAPFPAMGFRYGETGVVASDRPGSAAGTVLPLGDFRAWLARLAESGRGTLYLSPVVAIHEGRWSVTSNLTERTYVQNYTFDREGNCASQQATDQSGARVAVRATPSAMLDTLAVELDLRVGRSRVDDFVAAEGFRSRQHGKAPPLKIQLPRAAVHTWRAAALLRYDHSVIMGHWCRQGRTPPALFGSRRRVREHILCVATLMRRNAGTPDAQSPSKTGSATKSHAATLYWCRAPVEDGRPVLSIFPPPAPGKVPAPVIDDKAIRAALQPLRTELDCEAVTLGIALIPGADAEAGVTEEQTYVRGMKRLGQTAGMRAFTIDVSKALSGMRLALSVPRGKGAVRLGLRGEVGEPFDLDQRRFREPSLRALRQTGIEETYRRHELRQFGGDVRADVPLRPGATFRIMPDWNWRGPKQATGHARRAHVMLFTLSD